MKNLIILIMGVALLAACGKKQEGIVEDTAVDSVLELTQSQAGAAAITTGTIQKRKMGLEVHVNGKLDVPPQNLVTVSAPMGGFVKATSLLQGTKVKKGDVLVTLENMEYIQLQQDYLDSRSKLEFLEAEYKRQVELANENVNAAKTLQQAKAQYESIKNSVNALEAKLAMINISAASLASGKIHSTINLFAPVDGYITQVYVNIGKFVNATDEMFRLVNLDHVHAELQVYEKDIAKIEVGQKVTFTVANSSTPYTASVYLIGKEISTDGTINVHCHLDKENEIFLPGMFVTATIETSLFETEAVPSTAVVNFEGTHYVFISQGGNRYLPVQVEAGNTENDFTEIKLPPSFDRSTSIVFTGAFELLGLLKNKEEE